MRNNRKKGGETLLELNVNGIDYKGEEKVIEAFREHFSQLATFRQQNNIDLNYHKQAEDDIVSIDNLVEHKHIAEFNQMK